MENSLKIFEYGKQQVRTVEKDGEAWFVAKDVAEALAYTNPQKAIRDHVESEDRRGERIVTPSGTQTATVINEAGVYSLIFSSKLPSAKQFKRWVTHEVLPDIHKHGMYISDKLRDAAQVDPEMFEAVMNKYLAEKGKVKALQEQIIADAPFTTIGKIVQSLPGTITVADTAQTLRQRGIKIGRNLLYKLLRQKKLLSTQKKRWNKPTQKGIDSGIVNIELIEPGVFVLSPHAMITADGVENIYQELFADEYPLAAQWEFFDEDEGRH